VAVSGERAYLVTGGPGNELIVGMCDSTKQTVFTEL
jgi:hypothetical protein